MKKTILLALMFATLFSYANDNTNSFDNEFKKIIKVEFNNVKKGQTLSIKNDKYITVYKSEIKNSGNYSKSFDFSALENGIYSAELNKDFEIIIKQFYVKNGLVTFLDNNSEKIFKPVVRNEGQIVYISKMSFNENPLDIVLYYNDEVILTDTIKSEKNQKRIYKLSENKTGNYKVIINTNDRTYIKEFKILK